MHPLSHLQVFAAGADDILDYKPHGHNALLIRILDDDCEYHPMEYIDDYTSVFELHIVDIDLTEFDDEEYTNSLKNMFRDTIFTEQHAKQLIQYLQQYTPEDISQIVVHCMAGVSRSVAVAYFIAKYYLHNDDNAKTILSSKYYIYGGNTMIREILTDTWCTLTNDTKVKLKERR